MNSYDTDIFFSKYYHLQSVRFELDGTPHQAHASCTCMGSFSASSLEVEYTQPIK